MSVDTQPKVAPSISTTIIAPDNQPRTFHRINIEYFALYHNTPVKELTQAVTQGLKLGLLSSTEQRDRAAQWKHSYNKAFTSLCGEIVSKIRQVISQLPYKELRKLSNSTAAIKAQLAESPNDYLRHFHLAWLYLLEKDLKQAEVHFNIAALQSQVENPALACFALRHLAEVRYRANRYPQALLAIKTAVGLSTHYCAELHFEYVRMLALANRTSESLKQLTLLINKTPRYEALTSVEVDFKRNPSFQRFFASLSHRHAQNILSTLRHYWDNDPLKLLDLDKELGAPNSLDKIQKKQINTIKDLPDLLLSNEQSSSQLIHQQSRQFVLNTLNVRKQYFIQDIEKHQHRASRVHKVGQWLIYASIVTIMALALSHALSAIANMLNHHLVVNGTVQTIVLIMAAVLVLIGMILLHFTPTKLKALLKKKQQLEHISSKLGFSAG